MKVKLWARFELSDEEKEDIRDYPDMDLQPDDPCRCGIISTVICPSCGSCEEPWYEDYVSHPMLLCDECEGYFVIDIFSRQEIDPSPEELAVFMADREERGLCRLYSCDLYKIIRVSNYQICDFEQTEKSDDQIIRKFIQEQCDQKFPVNIDAEILSGYNLKRRQDEECENVSCFLPVNSWNLHEPEIPYPENFILDHCGMFIYMDCQNSKGEIHRVSLWGD